MYIFTSYLATKDTLPTTEVRLIIWFGPSFDNQVHCKKPPEVGAFVCVTQPVQILEISANIRRQ